MKLIKILGPATVVVMAAMMFVGASSASAAQIDKCLSATMPCPEASIDSIISELTYHATEPELSGAVNEVCDTSLATVSGEGTEEGADATVESLTFEGNCSPCSTVTVEGLPYEGKLVMEGEQYYLISEGHATLHCIFGIECTFGTKEGKLKLVLGAGLENNEFRAEGIPLKLEKRNSSFCGELGSTGTWTANYVDSNGPWYFFLL